MDNPHKKELKERNLNSSPSNINNITPLSVILVNKPIGWTPLQCIEKLKAQSTLSKICSKAQSNEKNLSSEKVNSATACNNNNKNSHDNNNNNNNNNNSKNSHNNNNGNFSPDIASTKSFIESTNVVREGKKEQQKEAQKKMVEAKYSYAGRLDPMAHGLLLILQGEDVKKQKEMELTTKDYEFEVLFGVSSDTFDILGLLEPKSFNTLQWREWNNTQLQQLETQVQEIFQTHFTGEIAQAYPPYSSARVNKKPLFMWAKEGKLDQITIPVINVRVHHLEVCCSRRISISDLVADVKHRISRVTSGNFRQIEIMARWEELLKQCTEPTQQFLPVLSCKATVGSGTYIRGIAHRCAVHTSLGSALAWNIFRTRVGNYHIQQALSLVEEAEDCFNLEKNTNSDQLILSNKN